MLKNFFAVTVLLGFVRWVFRKKENFLARTGKNSKLWPTKIEGKGVTSMRIANIILITFFIITMSLTSACKKASSSSAAAAKPSAEVKPIEAKSPDGWFVIEDTKYIPVLDEFGRHMQVSRQYFLKKDSKDAARHVREGATFLSQESGKVSGEDKARLGAAVKDMDNLADGLEKGTVTSIDQLDSVFAEANRADIEHRLLVVDEAAWVPFVEEPDDHFRQARADFMSSDYKGASAEIRKSVAFMNVEAARGSDEGKAALQSSAKELERLAAGVEKGAVKDEKQLRNAFAKADRALAKDHYLNASRSWAGKLYEKTGYELKAAAQDLGKGASWVGMGAEEGSADAVREGRQVAGKLIGGSGWTADEVGKAMENLKRGVAVLGKDT